MNDTPHLLSDRAQLERFKEAHPELGSALAIAEISEGEFIQTYADGQELDERTAYRVHQTAVRVRDQAALVWANLKEAVSPFLRQTRFNNLPPAFLEHRQRIPGYQRLFGGLDSLSCDDTRSVLSPAAYFVDLMRFVEETISGQSSIPERLRLPQRRPDLFALRLDDRNTHDLIPYIDLVNEVLEGVVASAFGDGKKPEGILDSAVFPRSLPVNLPLAEIRALLSQLDWDLPRLYETFRPISRPSASTGLVAVSSASGASSFPAINSEMGPAPPFAEDPETAIQRERLSLSPREFALLGDSLVDDRARLAEAYGYEELETALAELASVERFLERTGLSREELEHLVFQDLDPQEIHAGLSRHFFVNAAADGLGPLAIESGPADPEDPTRPPAETLQNLSAGKLDRIYRFLKLARTLEWSFADLDWALRSLEPLPEPERLLQFDGKTDFVHVPPAVPAATEGEETAPSGLAALAANFTLEAWVNPSTHQFNPILARGREDDPNVHFLLGLTDEGKVILFGSPNANETVTSLRTLPAETFSHVAASVETTGNASTVRMYVNGELDREATLPALRPPTGELSLNIGRNLSDTTFAGSIADVRIWAEARSAEAIADGRFRRLTGFETGLAAYWPLTETHGIELPDRTPYRQHGIPGGDRYVTQPRWITADLSLEPLPDRIGTKGFHFNGVDQFLGARGVSGLAANHFTLEAWVRVETAGHQPILTKGNPGNRQTQFSLWIDENNRLVFRSSSLGAGEFRGGTTIAPETFTHVAVTVDADEIRLYLDGRLDQTLPRPAGTEEIAPRGDDLLAGADFADRRFAGVISEVRIWNHARTAAELNAFRHRAVPPLAPGLIGYWPLDEIDGEQAPDRSFNSNPLYLGGVPEDYRPEVVDVPPLLPELPVAVPGPALQFDGDQDLLVLRHRENSGLGRYPQLTVEFWFKPTETGVNPEAPQLLFSQGDGEAGLAVYLTGERLSAIAWCADYELAEVQETVLTSAETAAAADQWHHIAIVHDETRSLDFIEFRGYLDGIELEEVESTHENPALSAGQHGFRLSPVGPIYLAGMDGAGITRFQGEYARPEDAPAYGFSGQMAELRLWDEARDRELIEAERHLSPAPDAEGLIAHLPLDEGRDVAVTDRRGEYTGQLRGRESVFMAAAAADPELENRYTHYAPEGEPVVEWRDYIFTGELFIPEIPAGETAGGLGVTFLSRHPERIDQFYRLQVAWPEGQPRFGLAAHPQGVQPLIVESGEFPQPEPGGWYKFRIETTGEAEAERTRVAVTVWPAGKRKPRNPQVIAADQSDVRLTAGTVGLWVAGNQPANLAARFNNLRVAARTSEGGEGETLLVANFKSDRPGENPAGWMDTGDRISPREPSDLFRALDLDGRTVLGTDSPRNGIHAHYHPANADAPVWSDFTYRAKLRITDPDGGIGLTFLSRAPEGIEQFYVLRREAENPAFHLAAHPQGVQPLAAEPESSLESGVIPLPGVDYFVRIEAEADGGATRIQAKVWEAGTLEPQDFQMRAVDTSDIRVTAGTVGVWAAGPGEKIFDDLAVLHETLLSEDFSAYGPEEDPDSWLDTDQRNSREEVSELFRIFDIDGNMALGAQSDLVNIHSHYRAPAALEWSDYTYTGRMRLEPDERGRAEGIGVTFFSRYPDPEAEEHDQYYRLRRTQRQQTFHIAPHPHGQRRVERAGSDTGVNPAPNVWHRFRIEVHDEGDRTRIRAKIWPEDEGEPAAFQVDTFDDNNGNNSRRKRLTAGTVGLWAAGPGEKYFDDLKVRRGVFPSADPSGITWVAAEDQEDPFDPVFRPADGSPAAWFVVGERNPFEPNDALFVAERIPDRPAWREVEDIPLLRNPLNRKALAFDGRREYLARTGVNGEISDRFTLEVWIAMGDTSRPKPFFSWGEGSWIGLDEVGRIIAASGESEIRSNTPIIPDTPAHVAVQVDGDSVTLFVNGTPDGEGTLATAPISAETMLDIGRASDLYFQGQNLGLRLWNSARSEFPISHRYQRPDPAADDLLANWGFGTIDPFYALDESPQGNHLRLGGLEPARKPTIFERDLHEDGDFWRPGRQFLAFREPGDGTGVPTQEAETPPRRHTVEIWFKVRDPHITQRRQVLYHAGDDRMGLVLYVHDGWLHFGGYDRTESGPGWEGSWIQTDRVRPDRWHHAAFVLDGRDELRPGAFRAYLDGKLVDTADGVQLSAVPSAIRLGDAAGPIRFHDGPADGNGAHLDGSVLELRIWNTARTTAEIFRDRYAPWDGTEPNLTLGWRFDEISPETPEIVDASGNRPAVPLDDLDRLGTLAPLGAGPAPAPKLNRQTLLDLATFRTLMDRHRLSVEALTALWYDLRHTGRADSRVFFDRVFNPDGLGTEPWRYHDPARRWDVTGRELPSRDRAIRNRLMGALRLSSPDLDRLVGLVSGEETPVEVDTAYLRQLYRLSQVPKALRLTPREYLIVLDMLGLADVASLADLARASGRVAEMNRIGVTVDEVNFFANDVPSDRVRPPFSEATIRAFADELGNQSVEFLVGPRSFVSPGISELESAGTLDFFQPVGEGRVVGALTTRYFVDHLGAVTDAYQSPEDLSPLAQEWNWADAFGPFDPAVFAALQTAGFVNETGVVLRPEALDQFPEAFGDNPPPPSVLADVQAALADLTNRQTAIIDTLANFRDAHRNAILAGLAELLGADPEPLGAVIAYFQSAAEPLSDPARLLDRLLSIEENEPLPADLLNYLTRLHKLLFLVTKFELTPPEIRLLLARPETFSVRDVFRPDLDDLAHLDIFTELKAAFAGEDDGLVRLLALDPNSPAVAPALLAITGWDPPQLRTLMDHFGASLPYNRVENLIRLQRGFALAEALRVDIRFLLDLSDTSDLSLGFYRQQADALLPALRALYDDEQWPKVYRPLRDPLALRRRDALLALAMTGIPEDFPGRRSPDLLSEYLLLDVQVSPAVETSRIVQGLAAVQQYVQRCLMNLESGVDPAAIPADQWGWMKNYRVWEANRKVFLFPESFIEPELRDTKTPLFENLELALMQTDITPEAVTRAYADYLNGFAEIANLRIVGAYRHVEPDGPAAGEVLHLVGRSNTQPRVYYHRERVNGVLWRPWKKIDLTINADIVSPVFAFGRLFLFWVEFEELSQTVGENNDQAIPVFRPKVLYSFPDFNGGWIQPQPYDIRIRGAAEVQDVFGGVTEANAALQGYIGDLDLGSVERSEFNEVLRLARELGAEMDAAEAAVRELGEQNPRFRSQLAPIADDLDSRANTLRGGITNLENRINELDDFFLFNIAQFSSFFLSIAIAEVRDAGQNANDAVETAFATLNEVVTVDLILREEQKRQEIWRRVQLQRAIVWPPVPDQTVSENNALVVEATREAPINTRLPVFSSMDDLTWSFWVHFLNPYADGLTRRMETTVELFNYAEGRLRVTATNQPGPINDLIGVVNAAKNGYGNVEARINDLGEASIEAVHAASRVTVILLNHPEIDRTDRNTLASLEEARKAFESFLESPENPALRAAIRQDIAAWEAALDSVVRYLPGGVQIRVWFDDRVALAQSIAFAEWRHLSLVMNYQEEEGAYRIMAFLHRPEDGEFPPIQTEIVSADRLPSTRDLRIAGEIATQPANAETDAVIAQLSEFRVWDRARESAAIHRDRNRRITARQAGLFRLPLNRQLANTAPLRLALSTLNFQVGLPFQTVEPRERIVLFYGGDEIIRTRRNNLDEQGLLLLLSRPAENPLHYDAAISPDSDLYIARNYALVNDEFPGGEGPTDINFLINNLPVNETTLLNVQNQPGWHILDTGDEQFLLRAQTADPVTGETGDPLPAEQRLQFTYGASSSGREPQALTLFFQPDPRLTAGAAPLPTYRLERLSSFAIEELGVRLFQGGVDRLLTLAAQRTSEVDFERYDSNNQLVIPPPRYDGVSDTIDFDGALGLYYWEIFFHIPFLIANQLNTNQNFAEAQRWYHYIFDPTRGTAKAGSDNPNNRYWRFRPLRDLPVEPLSAMLENEAALAAYREDPFDPHAVARLRINAYQKAVVMKYIDNLLDWGDHLFAQDNRESINEAFQLYVLAFNLLGPRPEIRAARREAAIGTYDGIRENFDEIPEFLTELNLNGNVAARAGAIALNRNGRIITTFCVPENGDFLGFWDRVEDRLFKIRHSLNIEGVFRQLALFQPPLDVRALVRAAAAGGRDIGSLLADLNAPVPHYRYGYLLERTREIIGQVRDFGAALLDALEKRDAERLTVLENTHERAVLELTTRALELERDEALRALAAMRIGRERIRTRIDRYQGLIDAGLNGEEVADLVLQGVSQVFKTSAGLAKSTASALNAIPNIIVGGAGIASPVALTLTGGSNAGAAASDIGDFLEVLGDLTGTAGSIAAKVGEYKRRDAEWRFELAIAEHDLDEVEEQIEMAELQIQRAEQALAIHERTLENNREIADFHRRKFTSEALYSWMVGRLSGIYFQAYRLAYDFAKAAERALQFELPTNERFVNFGHWDSLRRGLLAGEALLLDVTRMEKFHLDNDSRFQEIEKRIPLSRVDAVALATLRTEGACEFRLGEALYNRDYPGHYFRVIKSIALSLTFADGSPLADDPNLTVNGSLTQLGNKTLLDPDINAVRYLMGVEGATQPPGNALRVNWRSSQRIAVTRPRGDNGMFGSFDLNFVFDDRYFPFEGTGAVSDWRLEIPLNTNPNLVERARNADRLAIADVVLTIQYTSKFDQGEFRNQVAEEMRNLAEG